MLIRRSKNVLKAGLHGLFLFVPLFVSLIVPVSAVHADVTGGTNDPKLLFEKMLLAKTSLVYRGSLAYERGDQLFSYSVESGGQALSATKTLMSLNGPEATYELTNDSDCSIDFVRSAEGFADWYNFSYVGSTRVAGRDAHEITLSPVDPYRLAYSFVVDQETGLMLRSVTMLPDRRALERMEIVQLEIQQPELAKRDVAAPSVVLAIEEINLDAVSAEESSNGEELCEPDPESSDWVINWAPEGFRLIKQIWQEDSFGMVYGDGISTFSLFVEPVTQLELPVGSTQQGATLLAINYYAAGGSNYMITLVGEVPLASAERVLSNLDRKQ